MKKIVYLFVLAVLAVNIGCEKEEVIIKEQNETLNKNIINQKQNENLNNKLNINTIPNYTSNSIPVPTAEIINKLPLGTETINIYLNFDYIEYLYNLYPSNPPIIGSFNEFYRNQWLSSFTIYTITYSPMYCSSNEEKWVVNKNEYLNFISPLATNTNGTNTSVKPRPAINNPDQQEGEDIPQGYIDNGVYLNSPSGCFF